MDKRHALSILVGILGLAIVASSVRAEFLRPVYVKASSSAVNNREPELLGPGLSEESATATHNNTDNDQWLTADGTNATVDFYLNSYYDLTKIYFWNWNQNHATLKYRSTKDFTVQVSTNRGVTWVDPTSGATQNPAMAGQTTAEPVQVLNMTATGVNAVRFNITSSYGATDVGIAEVAFETTTALRPALPTNDYVTGVTIEAFSSAYTGRDATNVINGDGFELVGPGSHSTDAATMWMTSITDLGDGTPPFLTFDLGANCNLDSILVWNYGETLSGDTRRSAKDVEIEIASSDVGSFSSLGTFTLFRAPPSASWGDYSQVVDLSGFALADHVRRVRFTFLSTYGDTVTGLSEVRFVKGPPPPAGTVILIR